MCPLRFRVRNIQEAGNPVSWYTTRSRLATKTRGVAAGDGAVPIPVTEIPPDEQAGSFLEAELPKNPKKRLMRLRELLDQERERLATDKLRYLDVIERGIDALSRYDREIAHSNPEIVIASTLALKYRHISLGLGRIAWLEKQVDVYVEARGFRR